MTLSSIAFRSALAFTAVAGLFASPTAEAAPGDGVRFGQAVLQPTLGLGFEFRRNINQVSDFGENVDVDPIAGPAFTVRPTINFEVQGQDNDLKLTGLYQLRARFLAAENASQFNDFDVNGEANFLKNGVVGFALRERVALLNNNAEWQGLNPFHTRFRNRTAGLVMLRPGPVLEFGIGGSWAFDDFQVPRGARGINSRAFNRRNSYGVDLESSWTFFPRTAVVLEGEYKLNRWDLNTIYSGTSGIEDVKSPDSDFFKLTGGLRGRLTERLVISLVAGYGFGCYLPIESDGTQPAPNSACAEPTGQNDATAQINGVDGLLVQAQTKYEFDPNNSWVLGYRRDFDDVFFSNAVVLNRIYTSFNGKATERIGVMARFAAGFEDYRGVVARNDVFLRGDLVGSYAIQDWAEVSLGGWYMQRLSSDPGVEFWDLAVETYFTVRY